MLIYELVEEEHNNTLGEYTSFGIKAVDSCSGRILIYEDVFADYDTASNCIALFNDEQLEIVHLEEAIDDILHLI